MSENTRAKDGPDSACECPRKIMLLLTPVNSP